MVNPIYLIALALGIAFLLPLVDRMGRHVSQTLLSLVLLVMTFVPLAWLYSMIAGYATATEVYTAGFAPPLSINLRMGEVEAAVLVLANLAAFLGSLYFARSFRDEGVAPMTLLLVMTLGVDGLVMTRDLFNTFVFLEILSVSTYGLLAVRRGARALEAGFKYVIAGGLASIFFLLGTIVLYRVSGTLNIDGMIAHVASATAEVVPGSVAFAGLFLLFGALWIELKSFPVNGWALDVYQAADPGISAALSSMSAAAILTTYWKVLPLYGGRSLEVLAAVFLTTFVMANLIGLRQDDERRMLGYSSVAQVGLVAFALTMQRLLVVPESFLYVAVGGAFANHLLAKAGLFWYSGEAPSAAPGRKVIVSVLVVALAGFPPFPGFFAKWQLVGVLSDSRRYLCLVLLLLGSLFEAAYLLRWFSHRLRATEAAAAGGRGAVLPRTLPVALLAGLGLTYAVFAGFATPLLLAPLAIGAALAVIEPFPVKPKAVVAAALVAWQTYLLYPGAKGLALVFALLFGGGAVLVFVSLLSRRGREYGLIPLVGVLASSLLLLVGAGRAITFFAAWELMTVAAYLLILRRGTGETESQLFAVFSVGGAFFLLSAFALSGAVGAADLWNPVNPFSAEVFARLRAPSVGISAAGRILEPFLASLDPATVTVVFVLFLVGVLIKAGAAGLHLWLPGAYAHSDDEVSAFFSGVFSKAGIYALLIVLVGAGARYLNQTPTVILGWVGVVTAVVGALLAVFQEDAKYLLAYSSMSQLGYIVLAAAALSHLGWTTALYLTLIHAASKLLLFLAVAGVIARAGTSQMYALGGLIKRMPLTFISVLVGIIAVSGVPPLAGFGGKWLLYTTLLERGWYFQAAAAFFASAVAFLYLFRLIHTMFLGQMKERHRSVREAPWPLMVPQLLLTAAIVGVSMFPEAVLRPIMASVAPVVSGSVTWEGYSVVSSLGYWNGHAVMYVTMAAFLVPLVWLMVVMRRLQRVGQFNIVYAGERPDRPETTHVAHHFYAHYARALGFLTVPVAWRLWGAVEESVTTIAGATRRLYSGNGQTYAVHIVLFVAILYLVMGGSPL